MNATLVLPLALILCLAPTTESTHGTLQCYERATAQASWQAVGPQVPVLFGKNGLAWGRGLNGPQPGPQKKENDGKTPMGRFAVGLILGDAPHPPPGARWNDYVDKTDRTAWIDDPALPHYNHLYVLPPGASAPPWFERERVGLHDPAHEWEVLIEHNYPDAVPGLGSAIFFHIERGPDHPSYGCTVMPREALRRLILWLNPDRPPQVVQLDQSDYERLWQDWDLPAPVLK